MLGCLFTIVVFTAFPEPWPRHTVDASSQGADGVRLADANGDGLMDIATPWEEGGVVRVYLNPGPDDAAKPWPAVTVGEAGAPEDAVLVDLDHDGAMDVVSCSEGEVRTVWIHWAPKDPGAYLDPDAWTTHALPASQGAMMWMMCLPLQVDGKHGIDLVCGAKNEGAEIGWFEAPKNPRDLDAWQWHAMSPAGWVMSIEAHDMDNDGDEDILVSDRRGPNRGCRWLENPAEGDAQKNPWKSHLLGAADKELMFLTTGDLTGDGLADVLATTMGDEIILLERPSQPKPGEPWQITTISIPEGCGTGKGIGVADIDLDGRKDIVFTCEHAEDKIGCMGLAQPADGPKRQWQPNDISGLEGIKYDLVQFLDLDADGDLDVLTCEERTGLGVIWHESPTREKRK